MSSHHAAQVAQDDRCLSPGRPSGAEGNTVEDIAQAYLRTTNGDLSLALRSAIADALADLVESERRCNERNRLISHGYVRNALHKAGDGI